MLKRLRIKFVAVNMTIVTIMLAAIFVCLYISVSHRMVPDAFRGRGHGMPPEPPPEERIEKQIEKQPEKQDGKFPGNQSENRTERFPGNQAEKALIDRDPELFDEFVAIARRAALSNLIKTYLLVSVPVFILFLIISIHLANWMIKPVEDNFKRQRQFISDASHELKTPLTVITTNTELLSEEAGLTADGRQYVDNVLAVSKKMKGLVTGLLELAKSEDARDALVLESLSLSEIASRTALPFEPLFFENELTFSSQIEEGVVIKGQEDELSRLIEILLDNAIKYTAPGGRVLLKLSRLKKEVILAVSNTGEEIPEDELLRIFDRFYRTNKARTGMGSYGLGLALAKQIVSNHKGSIKATSANGLNTFTCIF